MTKSFDIHQPEAQPVGKDRPGAALYYDIAEDRFVYSEPETPEYPPRSTGTTDYERYLARMADHDRGTLVREEPADSTTEEAAK